MTVSAVLYPQQSSETLPELVRAAQAGELEAFELLVQRMQSLAYHWAYTLLQDAHLAEDAVQEAFIEAYLNLAQLREPAAFPGWLRRIIFKHCDRLTRHKHLPTVSLEPLFSLAIDDLNPSLIVEDQERHLLVGQAIAALPEHERSATLLFYSSDLSLKEIATTLNLPLSTIKKRLFDARKHLRGTLIASFPETYQSVLAAEGRTLSQQVRLLIAIRQHDHDAVRALLAKQPLLVNGRTGVSTLREYPIGYTPLHEAASQGDLTLVALLLEYGANFEAQAANGFQPLQCAILSGELDIVRLLLKHRVQLNTVGIPPLHWAAMKGQYDLARLLLEHGATVNARAESGRSALHWAALKGHGELVSLLLAHGAALDIRDDLGRTPRDWALVRHQTSILALLDKC
jgi:RNA polymerase sigma factor (sigma-70 family)